MRVSCHGAMKTERSLDRHREGDADDATTRAAEEARDRDAREAPLDDDDHAASAAPSATLAARPYGRGLSSARRAQHANGKSTLATTNHVTNDPSHRRFVPARARGRAPPQDRYIILLSPARTLGVPGRADSGEGDLLPQVAGNASQGVRCRNGPLRGERKHAGTGAASNGPVPAYQR